MEADQSGVFIKELNVSYENHLNYRSTRDWSSANQHGHRKSRLPSASSVSKNQRAVVICSNDTAKVEGGRAGPENSHNSRSCPGGVSYRHRWDLNCHLGLKSIQPLPSPPSRPSGGNGCGQCSCTPTNRSPCGSSASPVEACLLGLHEKYKDFYPDCVESHQPQGYRRAVEHDDLYLPASRPLSPASIDHDDLYLRLAPSCAPPTPRPSPCPPMPTESRSCSAPPSRPDCLGDIYLPPSRPCTPAFRDTKDNDIYLPPSPKCSPPRECFFLGGMATKFDDMPRPAFKPVRSVCSCKPSPNPNCYQDLRLPPSRPLTPMSVEPIDLYLPPSPTCSPSYSPSPSCSPSRCPSPTSSVYIDEHPSPTSGDRYISCKDCLCHKADSTRNLCPVPQTSCRDCVCHLGPWSPSQHGGAGPPPLLGGSTRCGEGFKTPIKPRAQRPTPSSCYVPSRPPSPPSKPAKSSFVGADPRCQSCDCHKKGSSPSRCSPPKPSSPCSRPPRPQCPEPLASYCFRTPPSCRLPFAAELLPANGVCHGNPQNIPSPNPCVKPLGPPPSCPPPKPYPCDPRCATCDCHKPKCPSSPSSPPPPPKSPSYGPCGEGRGPGNPNFKLSSPRCVDCDCHKNSKEMKCSMQVTTTSTCPLGCHCRTRPPLVDHAGLSNTTNMMQQPKLDRRCMQTETPLAPRALYPSCNLPGVGAKVDFPLTCSSERWELMAFSPHKIASGSQDCVSTQGCCCGMCDSTDSRSLTTSKCASCEHVHSCCCGVCACPSPSCGSKSPIPDPCTCMFQHPTRDSGILRDRPKSSNSPLMPGKPPCNVARFNNALLKGAMRSKSPNSTAKLRFLEPKVRHAGPECTSSYHPIITSSSFF